ncbi:T-complex protein 11 [Modicella reniformis]|uniref:T-complex protein 11 n=1 Tax=Modicella reniformis TaxID=1440133 RepID=A0A9P6IIJ4_9FUNG|nr:T-complex protein 11 [Modicella reniformis]
MPKEKSTSEASLSTKVTKMPKEKSTSEAPSPSIKMPKEKSTSETSLSTKVTKMPKEKSTSEAPSPSTTTTTTTAIPVTTEQAANKEKKPKARRKRSVAAPIPSEEDILGALPNIVDKPTRWTNWKMIHELALDAELKLSRRGERAGSQDSDSSSNDDDDNDNDNDSEDSSNSGPGQPKSFEDLIRSIARKAYFDKIREETEQGHLSKWISPLLTSIRERLLEMVQPESTRYQQITKILDLEFVQQQVDKGVFDIKTALLGVVRMMAQLCAPVRDLKMSGIQRDLEAIASIPLTASPSLSNATDNTAETTKPKTKTKAKAELKTTSGPPKDLVNVLQDILETLDLMVMDLANFRLAIARPKLEKQAIPYEQNAFRGALAKEEVSLTSTEGWLREAAKMHAARLSPLGSLNPSSAVATPTATATATAATTVPAATATATVTASVSTAAGRGHLGFDILQTTS